MAVVAGFSYFPLHFGEEGEATDPKELDALVSAVEANNGAEVILMAHGFRNSEDDASRLYQAFLDNFAAHCKNEFSAQLSNRRFLVGAVFWPSKSFREEEECEGSTESVADDGRQSVLAQIDDLKTLATTPEQVANLEKAKTLLDAAQTSADAQNEFADCIRSLATDQSNDPTEGDAKFLSLSGSEALEKLGAGPIVVPTSRDGDSDEGGAQSLNMAFANNAADDSGRVQDFAAIWGSVMGHIGHFLNLTLWYVMKNRSGLVGANGVAGVVRKLRQAQPSLKIHLVGHSLGGRVMASCAESLSQDPVVHPDSLTLLEAAFSHYGFSSDNGHGVPGFFRDVVTKHVVKGPFLSTYSVMDTVVGHAYALTSRLADDNVRALGDENDQFGGIGRNGPQRTDDVAVRTPLLRPGAGTYTFSPGKIWSLDGSDGLILEHGDVTNPAVTYAFASAVSQT